MAASEEPAGPALLDAARHALLDEVIPALDGRARYVALMAVNAIGIAMRDGMPGGPSAEADKTASRTALAAAIRAGARDGEPALHARLLEAAEAAARVVRPPSDAG